MVWKSVKQDVPNSPKFISMQNSGVSVHLRFIVKNLPSEEMKTFTDEEERFLPGKEGLAGTRNVLVRSVSDKILNYSSFE